MFAEMSPVACLVRLCSAATLAAGLLFASATTMRAEEVPAGAPKSADKLELLLKQAGLMYQRIENPGETLQFKVMYQDSKGRCSLIYMRILTQNWNYRDGTPAELLYCFTQVTTPQQPISAAAAQKVAEFTDSMVLGRCNVNPDGVVAILGFVLRGVDADTLRAYVCTLSLTCQEAKEALAPLLTP